MTSEQLISFLNTITFIVQKYNSDYKLIDEKTKLGLITQTDKELKHLLAIAYFERKIDLNTFSKYERIITSIKSFENQKTIEIKNCLVYREPTSDTTIIL